IQNNNAMGMWLLRHGRFDLAEPYFRKAIKTITTHNPNPYDGEPFYNLGLCFFYQEKLDEAYNYFYKSIWNSAWQENGYFQLAKISCIRNEFSVALELVEKSLIKNWHNHKARHLKVAILRKLDKVEEALNLCEDSLSLDKFNFGVLYEKYLLTKNDLILKDFLKLLRNNVHTYIEYALDYAHAGYYHEASSLLELYIKNHEDVYPMAGYFLGWFALKCNDEKNAKFWFIKAEQMNPDYCFPNRLEEAIVLQSVLELLPECSKANYYLGNFWYASKQYEKAIECWKNSRELDDSFPTVRRNLALAYFNKSNNSNTALLELEKAFELDPSDARILMELDQLYKMLGKDFEFRLSFLEKHLDLVNFRDDLYLERITLLNFNGKFEEALELLLKRKFHPWEGGEGKVTGQYIFSLTEMAKQEIKEKNAAKAIELLERAKIFPHNLGEGKLAGAKEIDINYWLGCANEIINNNDKAIEYWKMASEGDYEPSIAMYYNDQKPDNIFYQGLALRKLGEIEKADHLFKTLCDYGNKHINDHVEIDYFAVSLPNLQIWEEDLNNINRLHCEYLIALGYLGQGKEEATKLFHDILNVDMYNLGAHIHQQFELV
ncbi:MAG: DUF5107 domain-containing protein, partial [Ignavibacteriae bacterium]|nr:DUF5107 domain-containing protein [Ignavibacteriota bacterium]